MPGGEVHPATKVQAAWAPVETLQAWSRSLVTQVRLVHNPSWDDLSTIFRCDYDHEHEMNYWDIEFRSCSHCLSWFSTHKRGCFWPKSLIQVEKTWGANFRCNHDHDHVGNYRGIESWSCSHCLNWFSIHIYSITYWVCSIWTVPYMRGRFWPKLGSYKV